MIAIVCGGRDFDDHGLIYDTLSRLGVTYVIEGGADGADYYAHQWALDNGMPLATVAAQWRYHGKAAGPIRNGWMLRLKPDVVIAFPGGRGTADMVAQARKAGVRVIEVK